MVAHRPGSSPLNKSTLQFCLHSFFPRFLACLNESPFSAVNLQQCRRHVGFVGDFLRGFFFFSCKFRGFFGSGNHLWQSFSRWWNVKNDDFIVLNDETIIYGFTNDFSQQLGLNLCLIIAKYYIYCASRDGEKYYFEAFLAYLKSKLSIEKSKCKSQIIL